MKLLIVTQTVDTQDQLLGFFVGWITAFSKHCKEVHVFCLNEGEYTFPDNVHIYCLGKSEGKSKFVWLYRLFNYSWSLRKQYDSIFVHMNPIHIVYTGVLWRVLGKKIGLWYTHPMVDLKLRVATLLSHIIFTGSKSSFGIKTHKKNIMGQGVDPSFFVFKERINVVRPVLVVVGRVSLIKNIGIALEVLQSLREQHDTRLSIVGGPSPDSKEDEEYLRKLKKQATEANLDAYITWHGPKDALGVRKILQESDIFLHTSLTHSADKTLPEAMASGLYVVSSNRAYQDDLPDLCFKEPLAKEYVESVEEFCSMSLEDRYVLRKNLRACVEEKHSLARLVQNILTLYT